MSIDPPGHPRPRKASAEPDYHHPLLTPLARAQDAVARLEAKAEMASDIIVEGLRARLSYLEAAGWLSYAHIWIHPRDLALRDNGCGDVLWPGRTYRPAGGRVAGDNGAECRS